MAYMSRITPRAFAGELSPWARDGAAFAYGELLESRSFAPFLCGHDNGAQCLIVPSITPFSIGVTLLYGIKRAGLSPRKLANFDLASWREMCRAFIVVQMKPELVGIAHDGTVRACKELLSPIHMNLPCPADLDLVFGTMFEAIKLHNKEQMRDIHAIVGN